MMENLQKHQNKKSKLQSSGQANNFTLKHQNWRLLPKREKNGTNTDLNAGAVKPEGTVALSAVLCLFQEEMITS